MASSRDPFARLARRLLGISRPVMLLAGIWALGLIALTAVIVFETRVDQTRRAQVVIAQMRNEQSSLISIAFSPATAQTGNLPAPTQTARQLTQAENAYRGSIASLAGFGASDSPARIAAASEPYFALIRRLSALVAIGSGRQAAREFGRSEQPGGIEARLTAELDRADHRYGAVAARSREVATLGTLVSIVFLLLAFSFALRRSVMARRRSEHDATIDALTGLGNRRKLFADMQRELPAHDGGATLALGIFDLDGFKAYNDTFGHPAGDALLERLGARLVAAVGERGSAYRIGGDEFVVITGVADGESVLTEAQAALSEEGPGFSIGCSRGSTRILAGITLEQALHVADQRLYANKRSARGGAGNDAKAALLQVLSEQNQGGLVSHLGQVAELAARTATSLHYTPRQVELIRLAAELHDVGKTAIPPALLQKASALDAEERLLMQRHSAIGERIVAAAPALEAIGPIVRGTHERPDGSGYPDGLRLDQIPMSARIIAVVDAFDAMTNDRPYRSAMLATRAIEELRRNAGTQFDPVVVEAFAEVVADRTAAARAA